MPQGSYDLTKFFSRYIRHPRTNLPFQDRFWLAVFFAAFFLFFRAAALASASFAPYAFRSSCVIAAHQDFVASLPASDLSSGLRFSARTIPPFLPAATTSTSTFLFRADRKS